GVGMAIAAHRANKPRTMGTLYWQLNDVWPAISWSSMDVFGRWKPLHYRVRDLYQPLFAEVYHEGDSLRLRVVNDGLEATNALLEVDAFDTLSGWVRRDSVLVDVGPNGVVNLPFLARSELAVPDDQLVFRMRLIHGNQRSSASTSTLLPRWKLNLRDPELRLRSDRDGDRNFYWVSSEYPAFGVWIEDRLSGRHFPTNYSDVFPFNFVGGEWPAGIDPGSLVIHSLYDLQQH
ncbi:MAG: hypothetical protein R3284_11010, partial [Rubricoccaceae bacterium]|nr:hypothetical protein [Rubricoccaceae bacterium]